jgi:hypothetical protein
MKLTLEELEALVYFIIKTLDVKELNYKEHQSMLVIKQLHKKLEEQKVKEDLLQAIEDGVYE